MRQLCLTLLPRTRMDSPADVNHNKSSLIPAFSGALFGNIVQPTQFPDGVVPEKIRLVKTARWMRPGLCHQAVIVAQN